MPFFVQLRFKSNCGLSGSAGISGDLRGRKMWSFTRLEQSNIAPGIVSEDTGYRGVYQAYQEVGPEGTFEGMEENVPSTSDFTLQPRSEYLPVAPPANQYCSYQNITYGGGNRSNCWTLDDEWVTYLIYVVPATHNTANGRFTVWGWRSGMAT